MLDHDIGSLEKRATNLWEVLRRLADEDDFNQILKHWRQPGWTTPAEFLLVDAVLGSLQAQAEAMLELRGQLLDASREIVEAVGGVK